MGDHVVWVCDDVRFVQPSCGLSASHTQLIFSACSVYFKQLREYNSPRLILLKGAKRTVLIENSFWSISLRDSAFLERESSGRPLPTRNRRALRKVERERETMITLRVPGKEREREGGPFSSTFFYVCMFFCPAAATSLHLNNNEEDLVGSRLCLVFKNEINRRCCSCSSFNRHLVSFNWRPIHLQQELRFLIALERELTIHNECFYFSKDNRQKVLKLPVFSSWWHTKQLSQDVVPSD